MLMNDVGEILEAIEMELPEAEAWITGEKRLLIAMILRAVEDLTKAKEAQRAKDWIFSNTKNQWGYVWICEHLEVDPQLVRSFIQAGRRAKKGAFI